MQILLKEFRATFCTANKNDLVNICFKRPFDFDDRGEN